MNISLIALAFVLGLIAVRRIGRLRVQIWQAMLLGATVVLVTGEIGPRAALAAIDLDVMLFLAGMFVLGEALLASGYLQVGAYRFYARLGSVSSLVFGVLVSVALASALLMNDTLAIIGTPLVLRLAQEHRIDSRLLLLTLAFGVTLGSVMSPIGNPQNLLIVVDGQLSAPFTTFLAALGPPTLINLVLAYWVLRRAFAAEFHALTIRHVPMTLTDPALARYARMGLMAVLVVIGIKIVIVTVWPAWDFRLTWVALAGALPVLLCSRRRSALIRRIDWRTLVFFAAMFVLMQSVWQSGVLQAGLIHAGNLTTLPAILGLSVSLSQLVSNVPLVALYLPVLQDAGIGVPGLLALAAGSTIAGNLLLIGAASNVIIVQAAERDGVTLDFWTFARIGAPLTLLNLAVYGVWLALYFW